MISILIPVFNQDISKLVQQLDQQASQLSIPYEIIALDDGSKELIRLDNKKLESFPNFRIFENNCNLGRSATRNLLAGKARFDYLIYLDCDVVLISPQFLNHYQSHIKNQLYGLVSGGCIYEASKPKELHYILHWAYGTKIENPVAKQALFRKEKHFHSVNFMINKQIIVAIPFQENITTYGHEDSLWEHDLRAQKIQIIHIENPVLHLGLNTTKQFLRNVSSSVKNTIRLNKNGLNIKSSLQKAFRLLSSLHLLKFYFVFYKKAEKFIVSNLRSGKPNLSLLALFKLGLYIRFTKKHNG